MKSLRNSRGDTIVEVLIALGVLTTVLVGAYVTADRSQNASQASQERGEAIKTAESQIERLKAILISPTAPTVPSSTPFCIDDSTNVVALIGSPQPNPFGQSLSGDTLPYPNPCIKEDRYNVAIFRSGDTYNFLVRWERIGGNRDQINMYYKVY
ncbi:hypothetical protein H0X10_01565 [Candidatus Saccharibacteria bacterium]|nr:hypothetical protein [Candidatus Saccharibacteria bacterium]